MQNLYTFSIIAPASSLCLHTRIAILLIEVALHVLIHQNNHVFFCKHVDREKFPASLRKQKMKNKKKVLLGLEPSTLFSDSLSTTVKLTAPSNRWLNFIVNTNNCMA